jgi:hypothetical protein
VRPLQLQLQKYKIYSSHLHLTFELSSADLIAFPEHPADRLLRHISVLVARKRKWRPRKPPIISVQQLSCGQSTINWCSTYLIICFETDSETVQTIDPVDESMACIISWLEMATLTIGRCRRGEFASIPSPRPLHLPSKPSNLWSLPPQHHLPNDLQMLT